MPIDKAELLRLIEEDPDVRAKVLEVAGLPAPMDPEMLAAKLREWPVPPDFAPAPAPAFHGPAWLAPKAALHGPHTAKRFSTPDARLPHEKVERKA